MADVRLRFLPKPDKDIRALRDGEIDLDIGVIGGDGAALRAQTLYRDIFVGVARPGHPLLEGAITPARYAAFGQAVAARRDNYFGPADDELAALGLRRDVRLVVPGFPAVLAVVAASDLIGMVPRAFCDLNLGAAIQTFALPVDLPDIIVSQIWHPRLDADPAHRWLRAIIHETFRGLRAGE